MNNFFKENKYIIEKSLLNNDLTLLLYNYCLVKTSSIAFKYENDKKFYSKNWDGDFTDIHVPNTYSMYGDPVFDTLLVLLETKLSNIINQKLKSNYSYWRLYQRHNDLKSHIDRKSCEISITLCLGYNIDNLDDKNYVWPIYLRNVEKDKTTEVLLKPGDCLIYKGCDLEHWRENFLGNNQAQVFLHYENSENNEKTNYDGRYHLGIPKNFKINF